MDDFVIANLHESRNEWCCRLVSIFTPLVQEGLKSLFDEAWNMCVENNELDKYLMTYQNLLSRIPKWNEKIIEDERKRIIERSGCNYLEDLISCVHIIQLKVLTCIRVGNKQKKIDISIPKIDIFIHKIYVNAARKIYKNTYLYDKNVNALEKQKNMREIDNIIEECIMMAIRDSIPTEEIIRAYMDEAEEQEDEVIIEDIPIESTVELEKEVTQPDVITNEEDIPEQVPSVKNIDEEVVKTQLTFNDIDSVLNENNEKEDITAPKSLERLEEISTNRAMARKLEELADDDDDENNDILNIGGDIKLTGIDEIGDDGSMKISSENIVLNDVLELPS
jgi:hypothetical protein